MALKKVKKRKRSLRGGRSGGAKATQRPHHVEKTAPCRHACPSGNLVRGFLMTIAQAEKLEKPVDQAFQEAWEILTETSPFPTVCGRVCPHPCEDSCNRKDLDSAVNINGVERAIGDFGLEKKLKLKMLSDQKRTEKVAVVGAGPGGLSCAYQLARRGYQVTVFEASEEAGGIMRRDISRSQLPADVLDGEIQKILDLGVEVKYNTRIREEVSLEGLRAQYQAVCVDVDVEGLGVEGDQSDNASVVEFLDIGDVAGLGAVTTAIGQGRRAAESIDRKLGRVTEEEKPLPPVIVFDENDKRMGLRLDHYPEKARVEASTAEETLSTEQVVQETGRCMSCGYCSDCEKCWLVCPEGGITKPQEKGALYEFNLQMCTGCMRCARECPTGFITMQ